MPRFSRHNREREGFIRWRFAANDGIQAERAAAPPPKVAPKRHICVVSVAEIHFRAYPKHGVPLLCLNNGRRKEDKNDTTQEEFF